MDEKHKDELMKALKRIEHAIMFGGFVLCVVAGILLGK